MAQSLFKVLKLEHPYVEIDVLAPLWSVGLLERMPEVRSSICHALQHGRWQPPPSSGPMPHQPPTPYGYHQEQHPQQPQPHDTRSNFHVQGRSNNNALPNQQQRFNAPQPPRHQGYNFQAFAQQQPMPRIDSRPPPHQQRSSGRADGNVMNNLRAQLVSTLKQNRQLGQCNEKRR